MKRAAIVIAVLGISAGAWAQDKPAKPECPKRTGGASYAGQASPGSQDSAGVRCIQGSDPVDRSRRRGKSG